MSAKVALALSVLGSVARAARRDRRTRIHLLISLVVISSMLVAPFRDALFAGLPGAAPAPVAAASSLHNACDLYPIALHQQSLVGVPVGGVISDIYNGGQPGNFGWLSWAGSPSDGVLAASLAPPGDVDTYANPFNPADHAVSVGDWVPGSPGVSNSSPVRAALDRLLNQEISVPVWDAAANSGSNGLYHIVAFARVRPLRYSLPGQNVITAEFRGYVVCGNPTPVPTVTRTPTNTPTNTPTPTFTATPPLVTGRTYTVDADFDEGTKSNVDHIVPDQLQLDNAATPFHFIWIAVSTKGTVVKIDTDTGQVLGEYWTSPAGQPKDPSRTTVDLNGNVWATNRAGHSLVHIGLVEHGGCVDRNGNGRIDTSTGLNDIKPWTNAGGADTGGGVSTAADECIINYTLVHSWGTRHVAVTADNNIWVSGSTSSSPGIFDLVDGNTGAILHTEGPVGYGGYGGLIDRNGVIWSARPLLRWDTHLPLSGPNGGNWTGYGHDSYGLCIDSAGNVWNTALNGNQIRKFAPNGALLAIYGHGAGTAQGCVIDRNDHVWVAHSLLGSNTVGHLKPDGSFVGNVIVGSGPTGVAVDARGKIWATNYDSRTASRIDPNAGPLGPDGVTHVGAVDFTTVDLGGNPYDYSDMTGSTLTGTPNSGSWTAVFDSQLPGVAWGVIGWSADVIGDGALVVTVASSQDGTTFGPPQPAINGGTLGVANGRYLKITVTFTRASTGESPILGSLTVGTAGYSLPPSPTATNTPPATDTPPPTPTSLTPTNTPGGPTDTPTTPPTATRTPTRTPTPLPTVTYAVPGWLGGPASGSVVSGTVPITLGAGVTLQQGVVDYYPASDPGAVTVLNPDAQGGPGTTIAVLDTTLLANTSYVVRLTGTDGNGNQLTSAILVTAAGENKPGRVTFSVTDLVVPLTGLPISIGRTYDSLERFQVGDFGYGWKLSIGHPGLEVNPQHDVTLTLPNGQRTTFFFRPQPLPFPFSFFLAPTYVPEAGVHGGLIGNGCGLLVNSGGTLLCFLDVGGYNPTVYVYTDPSGQAYTMGADGTLQSIRDRTGNVLTFTCDGITSSVSNLSVPFVRDNQGRISQITDPDGQVTHYNYDGAGNLTTVVLPAQAMPITYEYDTSHRITGAIDPRGNQAATTSYYPDGRLQYVSDALGNRTEYAYDLATNTTQVTDPDGGVRILHYDSYGLLLSETDPLNRTVSYTYDATRNLTAETNALGQITRYTYDSQGNRTTATDPLGKVSRTTYDQYGNPIRMTDPMSTTQVVTTDYNALPVEVSDSLGSLGGYAWDSQGNPTSRYDALGRETRYTYDAAGNKTSEIDPLGATYTYTYDPLGRLLTSTDPLSRTTRYDYDPLGRIVTVTDPLNQLIHYEYDANGNQTAVVDPAGHRTTYTYDIANHLTRITYPDGTTQNYTYDFRGNVLTETDQGGRVTRYRYDLAGQLTDLTRADGTVDAVTTHYAYDAAGRRISETNGRGETTTFDYDAAGHLVRQTDPLGHSSLYAYDAAGRRITTTDPLGHETRTTYDARGRVTGITSADGATLTYTYDAVGNPVGLTDQNGQVTLYSYDDAGRLTRVINPLNQWTQYQWNAASQLLGITDANGHQTSFAYDALERIVRRTWPDGTFETFGYDTLGNRTSQRLADGQTNTFGYDALNRLIQTNYADGQQVVRAYTATGKQTTVTDRRGVTRYEYDLLDRLVHVTQPNGQDIRYAYDAADNRVGLTAAAGTVNYGYDAANRLTSVTDPQGRLTGYSYDDANRRTQLRLPDGITNDYTYDAVNRLLSLTQRRGGQAPFASYAYTLDPAGNRLSVTEANGSSIQWAYDGAYRLTGETRRNSANTITSQASYAYDPVGNRVSMTKDGQATTYTYNALDEVMSAGSAQYQYDARGNLLQIRDTHSTLSFAYDVAGRLIGAAGPGGTATFAYDADGRRVQQTVAGAVTNYLWDETTPYGDVVLETDGSNTIQASYVLGAGCAQGGCTSCSGVTPCGTGAEVLSQQRGNTASFYLHDGQGNVRALADGGGNLTDQYSYDAFGVLLTRQGTTTNPYLFDSQQFDALSGLYNLRARSYNPADGRFVSRDPAPPVLQDPAELDRYGYAGNNPVTYHDPTGLAAAPAIPIPFPQPIPRPIPAPRWAGAALEYALLLTIAIMAIPGLIALGEAIKCVFTKAASVLAAAAHCGVCLIAIAAVSRRECRVGICLFSRTLLPDVGAHMQDAQNAGYPMLLHRITNQRQIDANRRAACGGFPSPRPPGRSCDEYPFAGSQEGGAGASTRDVPLWENRLQGGLLSACYSAERIRDGDPFAVIVTP